MDLTLKGRTYAVGGASSGLGRAIAEALISEDATVIGIARREDKLSELAERHGNKFIPFPGDLGNSSTITALADFLIERDLTGCVLNTGGPPTGLIDELDMDAWDAAYAGTLRWKIQLVKALLPYMRERSAGTFLFVESISIKQPIDNLVLSNTFRAAVAGFVKTLSREEGKHQITANILAPGYHATDRITSVLDKAASLRHSDRESVEQEFLAEVPLGRLGDPAEFAKLAVFLLSPAARYITGQTITVDGGTVRHLTG